MAHEPRLFGYARVSTEEQSLDLQIEALRGYGIPDDFIVTEKTSGKTMERKQLGRILKALRPGDSLVVWKLDRLGRTIKGLIEAVDMLRAQGVHFVSIRDNIDTETATGRFFFHIMAAVSELERGMISERTKAGIAERKRQGVRFGPVPSIAGNTKRIARFQELYDAGRIPMMTAQQIVDEMNLADPKARKITSPETYRNWRRKGYPGAQMLADGPLEDGE
jgi:DNA invertase Pin-like site-specific DNA recombinase